VSSSDKLSGGSKSGSAAGDSRLFTAMMEDAAELCERRNAPVFTDFLTEEEQGIAISVMKQTGANYLLFGGYENAERCMLGVFPPYDEPDTELFPMDTVTAEYRTADRLDHRSVLGTLMAQGIERSCIGDILIESGRCVFFCRNTVTRALLNDIRTMGGTGVKLTEGCESPLPDAHKFKEITDTVASARLDCLVAALACTGRSEAERKITAGDVLINSVQCKKVSQTVHEGEKITIRGDGKFIIDEIGTVTRKGRLMLSARKYI
jgi:RNA-binding protein YlmH